MDEQSYNLLNKIFSNPINEISRKVHFKEKNSSYPEIEIHLLKYKLLTKIIRVLNNEIEIIKGKQLFDYDTQRKMKFHIIIPGFIDQEKDKNILYNILDYYSDI